MYARPICLTRYFSAPITKRHQDELVMLGSAGTCLEDLPQFVLLMYAYTHILDGDLGIAGVVTTCTTAASIMCSLFQRLLACVTYNSRTQYHRDIKGVQDGDVYVSYERGVCGDASGDAGPDRDYSSGSCGTQAQLERGIEGHIEGDVEGDVLSEGA